MLQEQGDEWQKLHLRRSHVVWVLVKFFVCTCFSHSRRWSRRPICKTFLIKSGRTCFSNCHITVGHVIVGRSIDESQERESIMFCSQQCEKTQIVQFANSTNWYLRKKISQKKRKDEKPTCYLKIIKQLVTRKNTDKIT